jgi:CBS domain containing-hemolysin-like protein
MGISETATRPIATVVAIAIATIFSMIIGELVPKNFALAVPRQTAKLVMGFQVAFTTVFKPAIIVLNGSANGMLRAMGIEPKEELSGARSAEELSSLVRRSASAGVLEQDTASLLDHTLRFARLTTADVMTPRPSIEAVAASDSTEAVVQLARRTGFSRFPVYDGSMDDITGIAHLKRAIGVPRDRRPDVPAAAIAEDALRVPETMHLDSLMAELRARGYQMAIVVDEYGGTAGIVTLEDLVEEIVGEVLDEHDRSRAGIVRKAGGLVFPGELRPDELLERTGIRVPESEIYDTVGGFMMAELGHIPVAGDVVDVLDGTLTVQHMDGRRVDRVTFLPRLLAPGDGEETSPGSPPTPGTSAATPSGGGDDR